MDELKACPFCGHPAYTKGLDNEVTCMRRSCPGYYAHRMSVSDWNTRPIEDALRAQLAAANERLAKAETVADMAVRYFHRNPYDPHQVNPQEFYAAIDEYMKSESERLSKLIEKAKGAQE